MRISQDGLLGSAVAMAAVLASGLAQAQETDMIAPHQHAPASIVRIHDGGTADSTNWSGYAVTGPTTRLRRHRVVDRARQYLHQGSSPNILLLDRNRRWTSKTVEQIGTDSDCRNGSLLITRGMSFIRTFILCHGMTNLTPAIRSRPQSRG